MAQPIAVQGIPRGPSGLRVITLMALILVIIGVIVGCLYLGRIWWSSTPKVPRSASPTPVSADTFLKGSNGAGRVSLPIDEEGRADLKAIKESLKAREKMEAKLLAELEALKKAKRERASDKDATATKAVPTIKRPPLQVISHARQDSTTGPGLYMLGAGTWIPCQLEVVLNSEIEGLFTVKTKHPIYDSDTGTHVLIPQGHSIVAQSETSDLLFGNERIPTFALRMSLPGRADVDLGNAPIVDATGTNGLTGTVDNHVWRLVWTSVFIGGLRGGQQVLQQQIGANGMGPIASGITREGSQVSQQRLGRAQDTRPTIDVAAGQSVNILIPKAIHLPAI